MPEYLKALHERFTTVSPEAARIQRERVLLLHLLDLEDDLRDQTSLDSFLSGVRLARGIGQELGELPPYSFDGENEEHARKRNGGDPQCKRNS